MIGIASGSALATVAVAAAVAATRNALRLLRLCSIISMNSLPQEFLNSIRGRGFAFYHAIGSILGGLARPRFAVPFLMIRQVQRGLAHRVLRVQRHADGIEI